MGCNAGGMRTSAAADEIPSAQGSVSSMQAATLLSQENVAHSDLISGAYEGKQVPEALRPFV